MIQKVYFSDNVLKKRSHYHDCHQIVLIKKGAVQFSINRAEYIAKEGDLLVISRYENHSLMVLSEEYERYVLQLDPFMGSLESRAYSLLTNRPQGFCNVLDIRDRAAEFEQIFLQMIEEERGQYRLSEDMQRLLVHKLLIMIYRYLPELPDFDETVYAIQKRFENQYWERYTIDGLAREYNVSASSLFHRFKKRTGSSVMDYLLACRMAAAKNDLIRSGRTIGDIVDHCGFSDASNFSRTFKDLYGMSPSAFRKKYKSE